MKSILLVMLVCLVGAPAMAENETIFGGPIVNGGYGAPVVKFGQIGDESAVWVGGKGGWLINHTFMIGGGGYGLANEVGENTDEIFWRYPTRKLGIGYGGFIMEYINKPNRLVHFSFETLIGAGGATYLYRDWDDHWDNNGYTDAFFVLEPGINIMLNFTENIRAGAGISYLYSSGLELYDFDDSDLSGPMGQFVLKFGYF
ncbi:MAG: hypothetical protein GY839_06350 [candidate division Zixibacteria bacterium]|nr:hypothetical protein [candidate division Zixibacteria bacterium]